MPWQLPCLFCSSSDPDTWQQYHLFFMLPLRDVFVTDPPFIDRHQMYRIENDTDPTRYSIPTILQAYYRGEVLILKKPLK